MTAVSGQEFGARLVKALGLEGRPVRDLTLSVNLNEAVTVRFTLAVEAAGLSAEVVEYADAAHLEEVLNEVTALASAGGGRWRETSRLPANSAAGGLVLDGPAERLAVAVLSGDVDSAAVLADLVRECWLARRGAA